MGWGTGGAWRRGLELANRPSLSFLVPPLPPLQQGREYCWLVQGGKAPGLELAGLGSHSVDLSFLIGKF